MTTSTQRSGAALQAGTQKRIIDSIMELKTRCRFEEEIGGECELASREVSCLTALAPGESASAGELAGRMGLSASRASRIITSLREKGFLREDFDSRDRRAVSIGLTPEGARVLKAIEKKKIECETRLLRALDPQEVLAVRRGLDILGRAIGGGDDGK